MCGDYADGEPRVLVENKFWAGLTDNQPVSYLKQLAANVQPTVLLVIAPAARGQTLWRELSRSLLTAGIPVSQGDTPAGVAFSVATKLGPILALTSSVIKRAIIDTGAVVPPGTHIGLNPEEDARRFYMSESGIALVTRDMLLRLRK